jgi:flagellin-like protein
MKMLKNKKGLSPVVASIILIAVTVAVSIAVAAWMGALTFTFMGTEELKITKVEFLAGQTQMNITLQNVGTATVTISEIEVNGGSDLLGTDTNVAGNAQEEITISQAWVYGSNYQVKVVTTKGNQFYYSAVAPTS